MNDFQLWWLYFIRGMFMVVISFFVSNDAYTQVTPCLISKGIVRSSGCSSMGETQIYSGHCIAYMQTLLARAVSAEGLVSWNVPETCWGWVPADGNLYNEQLLPLSTQQVNCIAPYDICASHYCPDKYCDLIKSFVDLKATLIARAVNVWDKSGRIRKGEYFYNAIKQLVVDINAAYDCAGLRRPVIQGTIFENIERNINEVSIPPSLIEEFRTSMNPEEEMYYFNVDQTARNVNFDFDRIVHTRNEYLHHCPDITKIEARMWFFYLAEIYINAGYRSIHMGQMANWAAHDDEALSHTTQVLKKIRAYAEKQHTFILLTEENFKAKKFPGTDTFMFDFDIRALRLRELSTPQVSGEYDCYDKPTYTLKNTPCNTFPAIMDECVLNSAGCHNNLVGGYSPIYSCYLPCMPYHTYFDFGPGDTPPLDVASEGANCAQNEGQSSTWGYDDAKWFGWRIDPDCRKFWIADAIQRIRKFKSPGQNYSAGFMISPGILNVIMPAQRLNYRAGINPTADISYLMIDEPGVLQAVLDQWNQNAMPDVHLFKTCEKAGAVCQISPLKYHMQNRYEFNLINPNSTSIYSWHIQNPDSSWQKFSYGSQYAFYPNQSGYYTIFLRQDNLGFNQDVENYGTDFLMYRVYLFEQCCGFRESNLNATSLGTKEADFSGEISLKLLNDDHLKNNYHQYLKGGVK